MLWMVVNGNDRRAFLSSCLYVSCCHVERGGNSTISCVIAASADAANNITIYNAAAGHYAMSVGLIWWGCGMVLAIGYFVLVYRMFRGKVTISAGRG
jgi:cytochrome d ubiquinol oxidase subunit II